MKRIAAGFTLVELLVVVSIVGILASVVVVNLNSSRALARDAQRKATLDTVQNALELYNNVNNSYPVMNGWNWDTMCTAIEPYIDQCPSDPSYNNSGYNNGFVYNSRDGSQYALDATLENRNEPITNASINCCTPSHVDFYQAGTYQHTSGRMHYRVVGK